MIGAPRMTYATAGHGPPGRPRDLSQGDRRLRSDACAPLKFTDGLGGALAGRPIAIRYVDNRDLGKQAEKP